MHIMMQQLVIAPQTRVAPVCSATASLWQSYTKFMLAGEHLQVLILGCLWSPLH